MLQEKSLPQEVLDARSWLEEFADAVRRVDYDHGRAMFSPEVVGFGTRNRMLLGLDELEGRQWRNVWGVTRGFCFLLDEMHCGFRDGLIWIAVPWQSEGRGADARWFERRGRATFVLEWAGGRWLALHSHLSMEP